MYAPVSVRNIIHIFPVITLQIYIPVRQNIRPPYISFYSVPF